MTKTDWLTRAAMGCPQCRGTGRVFDDYLCDTCQRTATLLKQTWNAALDAVLAIEGEKDIETADVEALRERGPV